MSGFKKVELGVDNVGIFRFLTFGKRKPKRFPILHWEKIATVLYTDILAKVPEEAEFPFMEYTEPIDLVMFPTGSFFTELWLNFLEDTDDDGSIDLRFGWKLDSETPRLWGPNGDYLQAWNTSPSTVDDWAGVSGQENGESSFFYRLGAQGPGGYYGPRVLDEEIAGPFQLSATSLSGGGTVGKFEVWVLLQHI